MWTDWRSALALVQPETVIAWHRAGFRLCWTWKVRRGQPGWPVTSREVRDLIRKMCRENPTRGAPRIHGEQPQAAVSDLAHFPGEPPHPNGLHRLLHGAHHPFPSALRVSGIGSRPASHSALQCDRPPDCRVDRTATAGSLSL